MKSVDSIHVLSYDDDDDNWNDYDCVKQYSLLGVEIYDGYICIYNRNKEMFILTKTSDYYVISKDTIHKELVHFIVNKHIKDFEEIIKYFKEYVVYYSVL